MEHDQIPNYTNDDLVTIFSNTKDQKLCKVVAMSSNTTRVKLLEHPFVYYESDHFRFKKYSHNT